MIKVKSSNLLETAKSVDPTNTTSTLSEVTRTYDSFGSIKSETFDSGTVSSAIAWNPTTKVMAETITLPSGKNIVETVFSGLPKTFEYDGTKLLQYNYGTGNVLTSIRKNFDLQDNYSAELAYTYNNWRKVSRRTEEFTAQNAPTVADYEYTYSKGLHLIGKQENTENRRTAYQYDSYYRLRRVDYDCAYSSSDPTCANGRTNVFKCNAAESGCEDFQLDGVHNIRSSYENQTNFAWTVDGFNRLTQKSDGSNTVKYSYDSNNNMTGEDLDGDQNADIVYTYDKLNRLTSVTNADYLVEYSYDPFNRRTEKTVYYTENSDTYERTHKYAYDGWDIISEEIKTVRTSDTPNTVTSWQVRRYVDQGTDNHIIMDTVSCSDDGNGNCSPNEPTLQRIWFHKDERGNIIAISDGNGTIYERYRYRVYGEHEVLNADFTPKTTAAVSPFLWGGSLYETETNLYWMRNRYYHIDMHRFINQDPIGIWGDANNLGNGFAYVAGMVIEASDPTGLEYTSDDTLGKSILSTGNETSSFFQTLNSSGTGNLVIVDDGKLPQIKDAEGKNRSASGACFIDNNIYMEKNVAEKGRNVDRPGNIGILMVSYHVSPEAIMAHEMAEKAELEKRQKERAAEKAAGKGDGKLTKEDYEAAHKKGIEAEKQVMKEQEENKNSQKQEEEEKKNKGGEQYPSDPDNSNDSFQQKLMGSMLAKILRNNDFSIYDQGPVVKIQVETASGHPKWVFVFNPFYRGKDPLKEMIWKKRKADGSKGFVRNPFAPGAEYGYDSTTHEKWQQSGFIQPNVDPYSNLQQGGFIQTNVDPYWQ
ncbi:hypothetical protein II898_04655 [bacterium]|nr:hypothetical protein [bacterium]